MIHPGATHRGAPFVGRARELALLQRLVREGLAGTVHLLRVAGEPGMGRRRLIAEALRRGPDAEWVQLAPGDGVMNLEAWVRADLTDLLASYPEAPCPSWALHVLSRWAPAAGLRAAVPAATPERLPEDILPERLGSAVGAVLAALTGQTLVLVDAGLWPARGSSEERAAVALTRALAVPGVLTLAADVPDGAGDPPGVRTLRLGPFSVRHVQDLVTSWGGERSFATWLARVTGGHPLFVHETVRWLEELGHVRVQEETHQVVLAHPPEALPLPLGLGAVMESRYRRLPPDAAHLLALLTREVHGIEREAMEPLWGDDAAAFEDALSTIRRRDFLLHRSARRPLVVSSPLWREIVDATPRRRPRRKLARRPTPPAPATPRALPVSPLARVLALLDGVARNDGGFDVRPALCEVARLTRGRRSPAWDGVRGRLAVLAVRRQHDEGRPHRALAWARWGTRRLPPAHHPALRRALGARIVQAHEASGAGDAADGERRRLLDEALAAGHFRAASVLRAAWAEGLRRRGNPTACAREATRAAAELETMGDLPHAARARSIAARALEDVRGASGLHLLASPGAEEPVRIICFGRPRIVTANVEWPLALWPLWWKRLVTTVVSLDLLDRSLSVIEAEALLSECEDAPARTLEAALREANQLLRGVHRVAGGLAESRGRVFMSWRGVHGDARAFLAAPRGDAWRMVTGNYLPGVEGEEVAAARRQCLEVLRVDLARIPALDPESTLLFLEGPARVVEVADEETCTA